MFTLSGNHIMSIFDAALDAGLDLVHVRHEAAAVHMADAYGRLTGEPGIALVTGGPGHANAVGALFTALGAEVADGAALRPCGDMGARPRRLPGNPPGRDGGARDQGVVDGDAAAATLGDDIGKAMRIATSGRPGPVHLSLPSDLLEQRVESSAIAWPDRRRTRRAAPTLAEAVADTVLAAIATAARPIIFAGPQLSNVGGRALLADLEAATGDAGRDHGKPARHRRRHARRLGRSRRAAPI